MAPSDSPEDLALGTLLARARNQLAALETGSLDAELLLAHVLGKPRSFLHAHPEWGLSADQAAALAAGLARRAAGEPVAYLLGYREFWSLVLKVTPAVLIPRPETELLVEQALARLPRDEPVAVADLGTGSGAVALAIAAERPKAAVVATDVSPAALAVATANGKALGFAGRVSCRLGDWWTPLAGERFQLLVSNPPYVALGDPHLARGEVAFEPSTALVAGPTGLEAIAQLAAEAPGYLTPGGWLLLEHGYDQGAAAAALLRQGGFGEVTTYSDLAGHPRVAAGRWYPPA
ncbi:MAG: peptide chain release factor N(5)-glutamine methyltransferase [Candidatus Competibacterales bacterium]